MDFASASVGISNNNIKMTATTENECKCGAGVKNCDCDACGYWGCYECVEFSNAKHNNLCEDCFEKQEPEDKDARIAELEKQNKELEKRNKDLNESADWLGMEIGVACKRGCIIGDGHVGYPEWFGLCGLDKEELIKYKVWLNYEDDEEDEEGDDDEVCGICDIPLPRPDEMDYDDKTGYYCCDNKECLDKFWSNVWECRYD